MEKSSNKSPVTMEKPDDLTLEQCQEAFAIFRQKPNDLTVDPCQEAFAMFRLHTAKVNQAQKVQQCLFLIMRSQGLCHIREQIFGYLSYETLENCRKVSKLWKESLEKIALIKFLEEFGDREVGPTNEKLSTILPGWKNAAQKYGVQASVVVLEEVKDSLKKLAEGKGKCVRYPVHEAAQNGDVKLMEFILRTSFDLNTKDDAGCTAFQRACCNGQTETAQLIIQNSKIFDIDLNAKDDIGGFTAWHLACGNGQTETAQIIILNSKEFGIDLNAKDCIGRTAWHSACSKYGRTETVQIIIQNSKIFDIDLNAKDDEGDTALRLACCYGETETVQMILKNWKEFGIDIKAQNNQGKTALDNISYREGGKWNQIKQMLETEYCQIDIEESVQNLNVG